MEAGGTTVRTRELPTAEAGTARSYQPLMFGLQAACGLSLGLGPWSPAALRTWTWTETSGRTWTSLARRPKCNKNLWATLQILRHDQKWNLQEAKRALMRKILTLVS